MPPRGSVPRGGNFSSVCNFALRDLCLKPDRVWPMRRERRILRREIKMYELVLVAAYAVPVVILIAALRSK